MLEIVTMLKKILFLSIIALPIFRVGASHAKIKESYIAGIAEGFPPYQFTDNAGNTAGFDADILRLVFQDLDTKLIFKQIKWKDVIGTLMFTDKFDCVAGMEISEKRQKYFDFTSPYYIRKTALFVLAENNTIKSLNDLVGKRIGGDKDSYLEHELENRGIKKSIRIKQTKSKKQSMLLLKTGYFSAIIAPTEVGFYLAKKLQINVKIVEQETQGTAVALAVKKGNSALLNILENRLQVLMQTGKIQKIRQNFYQ